MALALLLCITMNFFLETFLPTTMDRKQKPLGKFPMNCMMIKTLNLFRALNLIRSSAVLSITSIFRAYGVPWKHKCSLAPLVQVHFFPVICFKHLCLSAEILSQPPWTNTSPLNVFLHRRHNSWHLRLFLKSHMKK